MAFLSLISRRASTLPFRSLQRCEVLSTAGRSHIDVSMLGANSRHRRTADVGVLRQWQGPATARLCPSTKRPLSSVPGAGHPFRNGCWERRAVEKCMCHRGSRRPPSRSKVREHIEASRKSSRAPGYPERIFAADDAAAWLDRFRAAGVPCAAINTYSQVLADPQVQHMGWVQPLALPTGHKTQTFGPARAILREARGHNTPSARPWRHNDEVLGSS